MVKEISVPQFCELDYSRISSNITIFMSDDLENVGLRNNNIGNGQNQITTERNQIIYSEVISFMKVRIDELYEGLNVRFTENIPDFLENKVNVSNIAGLNPLLQAYGKAGKELTFDCNTIEQNTLADLDLGNASSVGKICVYPNRFTSPGGFGVSYLIIFEQFDPDEGGIPVNNSYFDNQNNINDNDLLTAIESFGRLVGYTVAHEIGHTLGLVPDGPHNLYSVPNDAGEFLMDDGNYATIEERISEGIFNISNRSLLLNILSEAQN